MRRAVAVVWVLVSVVTPGDVARAAWTDDTSVNTPVAPDIDPSRGGLTTVADGFGGLYLVWSESGNTRIERMSPAGELAWRAGPVLLAGGTSYPTDGTGAVVSDGEGGLFVATVPWSGPSQRLALHRVRPDRSLPWGPDGRWIGGPAERDGAVRLISDGEGGLLAAWPRRVVSGDWCLALDEVWAQRLAPDGSLLWTAEGVRVCANMGERGVVRLAPDGAGGAWIGWQDGRFECHSPFGFGPDMFLEHVTADGALTFGWDGFDPEPDSNWRYFWGIAEDERAGALYVYTDAWTSSSRTLLKLQRVDAAGVPAWAPGGTILDDGFGSDPLAYAAQLRADGAGGAFVAWLHDGAFGPRELRVVRVDADGEVTWTRVVRDEVRAFLLVPRSDGRPIVAWSDGGSGADLTAQSFAPNTGEPLWGADGAIVSDARGSQGGVGIAPIGCATAFGWLDSRTSFKSVWAQRLDVQAAPGTAADPLLRVRKSASDQDVVLSWDSEDRCSAWHVVRGPEGALLGARDLTPGGVPGPEWADAPALHDGVDGYYVIW